VSKDSINEIQAAIAYISANNPAEYAGIKCTFGMVLVNYNCSWF
jgi:hypothetical protein